MVCKRRLQSWVLNQSRPYLAGPQVCHAAVSVTVPRVPSPYTYHQPGLILCQFPSVWQWRALFWSKPYIANLLCITQVVSLEKGPQSGDQLSLPVSAPWWSPLTRVGTPPMRQKHIWQMLGLPLSPSGLLASRPHGKQPGRAFWRGPEPSEAQKWGHLDHAAMSVPWRPNYWSWDHGQLSKPPRFGVIWGSCYVALDRDLGIFF